MKTRTAIIIVFLAVLIGWYALSRPTERFDTPQEAMILVTDELRKQIKS